MVNKLNKISILVMIFVNLLIIPCYSIDLDSCYNLNGMLEVGAKKMLYILETSKGESGCLKEVRNGETVKIFYINYSSIKKINSNTYILTFNEGESLWTGTLKRDYASETDVLKSLRSVDPNAVITKMFFKIIDGKVTHIKTKKFQAMFTGSLMSPISVTECENSEVLCK